MTLAVSPDGKDILDPCIIRFDKEILGFFFGKSFT